ncbi:MAG TPA: superoxide dismutase [Candidatus Magasanikbacteria bacterium]|nr:superoxide dismutase [Candidatus Magasanikbacteria bacterium]
MKYTLPALGFEFKALEPVIDARTVEIHYTKHHATYLDNFTKIANKYPPLDTKSVEEILLELNTIEVSDEDRRKLRNFGGGFHNHNIYWSIMGTTKQIDENLVKKITAQYGSVENMKTEFNTIAGSHFGSGWVWLVEKPDHTLAIYTLPNQDSPLSLGDTPIIANDLWEHAYYLNYQNRRAEYIEKWWDVVKIV